MEEGTESWSELEDGEECCAPLTSGCQLSSAVLNTQNNQNKRANSVKVGRTLRKKGSGGVGSDKKGDRG